jgi:hypothetical protein
VWRFDGTYFIYVGGYIGVDCGDALGADGEVSFNVHPKCRGGAMAWSDSFGAAWIFGGQYAGNYAKYVTRAFFCAVVGLWDRLIG